MSVTELQKKVIASLVKKSSNYRILNTQLEEPSLTYPFIMQKMPPEPFQCQSTFHCSIILFGSVSLISESQAFSTFTRERNTIRFFFFPLSIVALDASHT